MAHGSRGFHRVGLGTPTRQDSASRGPTLHQAAGGARWKATLTSPPYSRLLRTLGSRCQPAHGEVMEQETLSPQGEASGSCLLGALPRSRHLPSMLSEASLFSYMFPVLGRHGTRCRSVWR